MTNQKIRYRNPQDYATRYVIKIERQLGLAHQPVRIIFDGREIKATKVPDCEVSDWYEQCADAYLPHLDAI